MAGDHWSTQRRPHRHPERARLPLYLRPGDCHPWLAQIGVHIARTPLLHGHRRSLFWFYQHHLSIPRYVNAMITYPLHVGLPRLYASREHDAYPTHCKICSPRPQHISTVSSTVRPEPRLDKWTWRINYRLHAIASESLFDEVIYLQAHRHPEALLDSRLKARFSSKKMNPRTVLLGHTFQC